MLPARPFDDGLMLRVNRLATSTGWLHGTAVAVASYGIGAFVVLLLVGWWIARGRPARAMAAALWAGAAGLLAVAANQLLVSGFAEARPYAAHPALLVLADRTTDPAFPSDHAVVAGAVAAGLCLVDRRLGVLAWVAALVLSASRVYTAAHYPHDVAAGLVVGAAIAVLGWLALARPLTALVARLRSTPLHPLLRTAAAPG
jgi:undecaprenyl-diphosphatase